MNPNFNTTSPRIRSVCAAAAVLASLAITGAIGALAAHYADAQPALASTVTTAQS